MSRPDIVEGMENFGNFRQAMRRGMLPIFKKYGLSGQQYFMLRLLSKQKNGMTTSELAEAAQITPGAVSQFIDQLADKRLIERQQDATDRRVTYITVAPSASATISKLRTAQKQHITELFSCLDDQELASFIDLLKKIGDNSN